MDARCKNIYAGCDRDGIVKLFRVTDGQPHSIRIDEWVKVLDAMKAEPGEMLRVELVRDQA